MLAIYAMGKVHEYIASILFILYIAIIYQLWYTAYERGLCMGGEYTDAQKKAAIKYLKERTDSIQIRTPKGTKERWRVAATERGKSLNQFIVDTMETEISKKNEDRE